MICLTGDTHGNFMRIERLCEQCETRRDDVMIILGNAGINYDGGIVYYEDKFPNLLFAKDGELFDLDGHQAIVIGGAYGIDKEFRLACGYGWWPDEQPSDEVNQYVERQLVRQCYYHASKICIHRSMRPMRRS